MKAAFYLNLIKESDKIVYFIGGGGKSNLMFLLASDSIKLNKKIIITSLFPFLTPLESSLILTKDITSCKQHIASELDKKGLIYLGKSYEKAYIDGFTRQEIKKIITTINFDHLLIESDSVAGRSLSDYRAVGTIAAGKIDRVVIVLGSDAFNQAKNDSWLLTNDTFWENRQVLAPIHLAAWLRKHPVIKRIQKNKIPITFFINKVENIFVENLSIPLAKNLMLSGIERVFIGSVYNRYLFEVKP
jgi:hypothetical protein